MESIPFIPLIIIAIQVLFAVVCLGLLIYFAAKRIDAKKKENFEKRDN